MSLSPPYPHTYHQYSTILIFFKVVKKNQVCSYRLAGWLALDIYLSFSIILSLILSSLEPVFLLLLFLLWPIRKVLVHLSLATATWLLPGSAFFLPAFTLGFLLSSTLSYQTGQSRSLFINQEKQHIYRSTSHITNVKICG